MKVVQLYTGDDGESHFRDLPLEEFHAIVARQTEGEIRFVQRDPDFYSDWHTAPRRQYTLFLQGEWQVECADGAVRRFFPGDVIVAEDMTGHGHIMRGVGKADRCLVAIPLADPE